MDILEATPIHLKLYEYTVLWVLMEGYRGGFYRISFILKKWILFFSFLFFFLVRE